MQRWASVGVGDGLFGVTQVIFTQMPKDSDNITMKLFVIILILVLFSSHPYAASTMLVIGKAPSSYPRSPYTAGDYERYLFFEGRMRRYLIHVPSSYNKAQPAPVVLVFHGGGGDAEQMRWMTQMDDTSETKGFIAVYPDGTGKNKRINHHFNVGPGYGYPWQQKIDDVGFVKAVLDDLGKWFNIDSKRVYATGLSNGAMMCYRLASDLPSWIAAIAPIGAVLPVEWLSFKRPIAIMHFHGLEDKHFPFNGGWGKPFLSGKVNKFAPVMDALNWYIKKNNCPQEPYKRYSKGHADCVVYGPGDDGVEVVLWSIKDGGHTWPGGRCRVKELGNISRDISANELMWEFFNRWRIKG